MINSFCWSHRMKKSLALDHIRPGIADGTVLEVRSGELVTTARVLPLPFHDPDKSLTHGSEVHGKEGPRRPV